MSLSTWLSGLKAVQLSRVAFLTGAPISGTKPILIRQIRDTIQNGPTKISNSSEQTGRSSLDEASIVSIDLGLRNLAYAHLTFRPTQVNNGTGTTASYKPTLKAWQRIAVSSLAHQIVEGAEEGAESSMLDDDLHSHSGSMSTLLASQTGPPVAQEVFDSATLANFAYNVIRKMIDSYYPTHILLERQRFRSGGGAAVQEWSIRVGVFEGMLYAVLRTLNAEKNLNIEVHSIDPGRVTRYWLQGRNQGSDDQRVTAAASKKAKIDIVGNLLVGNSAGLFDPPFGKGKSKVNKVAKAFLARWKLGRKVLVSDRDKRSITYGVAKLDDLSDCLLQGIAWIDWQNKREDARLRGADAFADDPDIFPAVTEAARERRGTVSATEPSLRSRKRNTTKVKTA